MCGYKSPKGKRERNVFTRQMEKVEREKRADRIEEERCDCKRRWLYLGYAAGEIHEEKKITS